MNLELLDTSLANRYGHSEGILAFAPGRVNLIGDHTDYNEGFVLPITLEQGVYVKGAARADLQVRAYSIHYDDEVEFGLNDPILRGGQWHNFVRGMVGTLHNRFKLPHGVDMVIDGDLPVGSGLSSSAAVEVALLLLLQEVYNIHMDPVMGALLCQGVEHDVIGVRCGIMDQFASRLGKASHALFLDCRSKQCEHIPVDLAGNSILIVDSQVPRSLASSKYNERRSECDRSVAYLQRVDDTVDSLRDVSIDLFDNHAHELIQPLRNRARHVVYENERVLQSAKALRYNNWDTLGQLMNQSHASLRDDYEVSCTEIDFIVGELQSYDSVLGARITGAGFGGCVVSLVYTEALPEIKASLTKNYNLSHNLEPAFLELHQNREATVIPTQ